MHVLIGCEFSASVRDEFAKLGHNAWSCDLLPCPSGGQHIQGDLLQHLACVPFQPPGTPWDLGIFHPPCTYLTASAEWLYKEPPYHQKIKATTLFGAARCKARADAIDFARKLLDAPIARIGLENPIGALNTAIRQPDQIIQPYQFGSDASKSTCLWLKNLPPLKGTLFVPPRMVCKVCGGTSPYQAAHKAGCKWCKWCGAEPGQVRPRWANQTDSGQNKLTPKEDRWATRSTTYPGIAAAMAGQWGNLSTCDNQTSE